MQKYFSKACCVLGAALGAEAVMSTKISLCSQEVIRLVGKTDK